MLWRWRMLTSRSIRSGNGARRTERSLRQGSQK